MKEINCLLLSMTIFPTKNVSTKHIIPTIKIIIFSQGFIVDFFFFYHEMN